MRCFPLLAPFFFHFFFLGGGGEREGKGGGKHHEGRKRGELLPLQFSLVSGGVNVEIKQARREEDREESLGEKVFSNTNSKVEDAHGGLTSGSSTGLGFQVSEVFGLDDSNLKEGLI